ncbi:MAG: hypothetical protein QG673_1578 [Pseudomonadota bacterium]|nr:hypothetical protein [Pseudomonadota bacterium]
MKFLSNSCNSYSITTKILSNPIQSTAFCNRLEVFKQVLSNSELKLSSTAQFLLHSFLSVGIYSESIRLCISIPHGNI